MRKKWLKRIAWVIFSPVLLFIILMILLYVPPVQDFLRKEATQYASEKTHLDISVQRIDLRFPLNLLLRGVKVVRPVSHVSKKKIIQHPDTLLTLSSLNIRIQALPLFKGKVEIDEITLRQATVNSLDLIKGLHVKGALGRLFLESHGVDLNKEVALVDKVELSDTHVLVALTDTTKTPEDSTETKLNWRVLLRRLQLKNVSVDFRQPQDSSRIATHLGDVKLDHAVVDLKRSFYGCKKFQTNNTSFNYDIGKQKPDEGFDASHIALRNVAVDVDSIIVHGRNMNAVIHQFSMDERSGLSVTSLTGRLFSDSTLIRIPNLYLQTPHSEISMSLRTHWKMLDVPSAGHLSTRLDARIGKEDVLLFVGGLPQEFKQAYPFRPLTMHAGLEGNFESMKVSRLSVDLPGAFSLTGMGEIHNLTDSVKRNGGVELTVGTRDLQFLTGLAGMKPGDKVIVPDSLNLKAHIGVEGSVYKADLLLKEKEGRIGVVGSCNLKTQSYEATVDIDALQLHHFLPKDSLYHLAAGVKMKGRGFSLLSKNASATMQLSLGQLQYGRWTISNVDLNALLRGSLLTAQLKSDNTLLKMQGTGEIDLGRSYLDGKVNMTVDQVDLYKLGIASVPLERPFAFDLSGDADRYFSNMKINAGDFNLDFHARASFDKLSKQAQVLAEVLSEQFKARYLDHAVIRKVLPTAVVNLRIGKINPLSDFLSTKDITFNDARLHLGMTPDIGINGNTQIHGLHIDSLQLDTIFFSIKQDTTRMNLHGGVINGPKNPRFVFNSTLTGEIRNDDADLNLSFLDSKGDVGLKLGVNARPVKGGKYSKADGVLFRLTPDEPIVAFRKFHFIDNNNWIYLHKNMRVYANVDMIDKDNMGFKMYSHREDSVSLQNMEIELQRIQLADVSRVLPYLPDISGLLSAEARYIQTATSLQVSTEATVDKFAYEKQPIGNVGAGVTWLPGDNGTHYLNSYFTANGEEVLTADGTLKKHNGKDSIQVNSNFAHFPMTLANSFIPQQIVSFAGDIDGAVHVSGVLDKPIVNGELQLDSVMLYARQAGARYHLDNRPVKIENNQILFDKFAIYTTSKNPFTIDGVIDFRNLQRPTARLDLLARNYTLLNAPRTRESLVYGKVYVDMKGTLRGPLDALVMRGNMSLLGNTDVTYVMADSPLTVEDRLDGLVTFTSFGDTTSVATDTPSMALGGMDMLMSVHIDNAVRLRADLSYDRSKFVELEGGGDLTLQYTPQGDMNLTGRYTLSGGTMKYSLPVIPLKEFSIVNGSYVDWAGNMMNPTLNLTATERVRASVANGDDGSSTMVNFDVSVGMKNRLEKPDLIFNISAPDNPAIENELAAMSTEERSKQAIAMLATGIYLNNRGKTNMNMGTALNSVLQNQINALAGAALKNGSFSVGVESQDDSQSGGNNRTDYSFRYSQRFFNDRVQIIIGGKVSTGANATNTTESFIDNISLEYRLDTSGTRYVRVVHNKNYESILDGEITETGVGLVFRKRMDRLSELFIFKKKEKPVEDK